MPTIKIIDSIKIVMYFFDHAPPHFHVLYNEYEELIEIRNLETYSGYVPAKQRRKVIKWAEENQNYLMQKWKELSSNS